MIAFVEPLVGGFLTSAHCIGMCGGFAAAIGATELPFRVSFARQIIYSIGRIFTYSFLGACGGTVGLYLSQFQSPLVSTQKVFSLMAGVFMIVIGLSVLGVLRFQWLGKGGSGLFAPLFARFMSARGWTGFFLAGLATGFLPCGLVYSFLAKAVSTGDMVAGTLTMTAFGIGTVPAMVAIGCGSSLLGHAARRRIYQIAACFVILLGAMTVRRSFPLGGDKSCCHTTAAVVCTQSENFKARPDEPQWEFSNPRDDRDTPLSSPGRRNRARRQAVQPAPSRHRRAT